MKNIEEVKKDFEKKDSVFLICCHITNSKSLNLLRNLVDRIEERGYEFILSSHTLVPPDIIGRSSGFLYDKFNDKISIDPIMIFWTQVGNYKISSPYLSYGGITDETYVLGAVKNRTNDDYLDMLGWNFYMMTELAARGLLLMNQFYNLDGTKKHNKDLELPYPDLSKFEIYKK